MTKIKIFSSVLLVAALASCKKDYLDTRPSDAVSEQEIYSTTAKIASTLDAEYKQLYAFSPGGSGGHDDFGQKAYDLANDLMGNDMVVNTAGYGWFNTDYQYTEWLRVETNRRSDKAWFYYYGVVSSSNLIIKYIATAAGPQADKDRLKGEALALRAYAYFYLINYYQQTYKGNESKPGVPLQLDPADDDKTRGTVQEVYDQISKDLDEAATLLNGKTRADKTRFDVSVVNAFQARVALLKEDWATAATKANAARQGYTLMTGTGYSARTAFSTIGNSEWMWGSLIPSAQATIYASFFSHIDISNGGYAALGGQKKITKALYDQINAADIRKTVFKTPGTGTTANPDYNQLKFQVPTAGSWAADYLYVSAAEMYLIEAEALAKQGNDAQARTVLTALVSTRYPAYNISALSGAALMSEIQLQRRIELWGEGWSLIDIKRWKNGLNRPTGAGNHGSPNLNPATYTLPDADPKFLMRIPQRELDNSSVLTPLDQNPT